MCVLIAITWECLEFIIDHEVNLDFAYMNYGDSAEKYWYDTIGDVLIPMTIVLVILWE